MAKRLFKILSRPSARKFQAIRFELELLEADRHFQAGNFFKSVEHLHFAAEIQSAAAIQSGLSNLQLEFAGTEVMGPIGHQAARLGIQVMATATSRSRTVPTLLRSGREANPFLADCWQHPFDQIHLDTAALGALERLVWPVVCSVQWIQFQDRWCHLYEAIADLESEWSAQGRTPPLAATPAMEESWRAFASRHSVASGEPVALLHIRGDGATGPYGRDTSGRVATRVAEGLASAGVRPIWMAQEGVPFPVAHTSVIDLSRDPHRDRLLDLALMAHASVFIGPPSGPLSAAHLFGTPCVVAGTTGLGFWPWMSDVTHVPRPVLDGRGRELGLEILAESQLWFVDGILPSTDARPMTWGDVNPLFVLDAALNTLLGSKELPTRSLQRRFNELRQAYVPYRPPTLGRLALESLL